MGMEQKSVVVTAGLSGLGRQFTQCLLDSGAIVFPTTRDLRNADDFMQGLNDDQKKRCFPLELSLESNESIDSFLQNLSNNTKELYGLVNTAVCREAITDVLEMDRAQWEAHFGVNVFGTTYLTKSIADNFIKEDGAIVNISSFYSVNVPDNRVYDEGTIPTSLIYASSKASLNYITEYFAVYYAANNIRVNAILAGGIENRARQSDHFLKEYCKRTPMRRMAQENEFNQALLFFLSDESQFCTGQLLSVDGGWGLY